MILTNEKGQHVRYISANDYRKLLRGGKAPPVLMRVGKIPDDIKLAQQAVWALDANAWNLAAACLRAEKAR